MKQLKFIGLLLGILAFTPVKAQTADIYKNIEFAMPKVEETKFPTTTVSITGYGAISGGVVKNTEAFKKAIEDVSTKGGGKIVVPRGIWLTGPITFKSNINLHLEDGALLLFSRDFNDYPLVETSFEGLNTSRCISPISANNLENIAITGNGVIDGSGDAWRLVKKGKMTADQWKTLVASGGVLSDDQKIWFPTEGSKRGFLSTTNFNVPDKNTKAEIKQIKDFLRPVMVSIVNCNKVLLDGPTFQNSPAWNLHPLMSTNVILRNLSVRNPWYAQNGDGLDLESCKNVLVYNNTFDVGDDAICIKSGKDKDGRKRGMATENVIIKNNKVYHAHGGFVIGSEMSGGVKNMHVSNCTFIGTDIGLRFKTTRGRGGVVENIYVSNIDMINIPTQVIGFNMFYEGKSPVPEEGQTDTAAIEKLLPVTDETPVFKNIHFKNITATNSYEAATFTGLPEMNLSNITIEDSYFETKKGISVADADGISFKNVKLKSATGTGVAVYNSKNIDLAGIGIESGKNSSVKILGAKSSKIKLSKSISKDKNKVEISKEVPNKAVTY
jgi:polygalacturonase